MSELINLTGRTFGKWAVIEYAPPRKKNTYWRCRCECGLVRDVPASSLRGGRSSQCRPCASRLRGEYLRGKRIGKWTILHRSDNGKSGYWQCQCACGRIVDVSVGNIQRGASPHCHSCGTVKLPAGEAGFKRVIEDYQKGAKAKKREWSLSHEEAKFFMAQPCYYCKKGPDEEPITSRQCGKFTKWFAYNGLDRVDNKRGYTLDNVVSCCTICNRAKRALSQEVFMKWIQRLQFGAIQN